jgi:N-acetyl-alpha-D-glucosaminyl L-malate synthase BshA
MVFDVAPDESSDSSPMVIGQVCHGNLGGSSRMACRLANALARRGHEVHTFSFERIWWELDAQVAQHACRKSGHDIVAPLYWDWTEGDRASFGALLTAKLSEQQFDILHYHYAQPFAGIMQQIVMGLGERMPFTIGTLHGTDLTRCIDDRTALASLSRDLSATGELTTVSRHMGELSKCLLSTGLPVRVLPNFVDDEWPRPDARQPAGAPSSARPVILHVSNFRTVKDVSLLARLFIRLHQETGAELWLVGDGPEMPALRALLDQSPAGAAARYLGAISQPALYFRQATILISTSTEESFGLAILEAMASGVPVVATAVGGIPELVENDVTGLLFDPRAFDETIARVVSLLGSRETRRAMRDRSINRAEALREARVIELYEDLYRTKRKRRTSLCAR